MTARVPRAAMATRFMGSSDGQCNASSGLAYFAGRGGHDADTSVIDVMFTRLIAGGVALMKSPFTMTARSLCAGMLNSETPISLNSLSPTGATAGISLGEGALA